MTESGNDQSALVQRAIERPLTNRLSSATADVERIIEATYAVIQRSGTMDPTMRDILKEAGLSTQRFYRYFASKDDLLLAILDDGRRLLADYIEHRLEREDRGDQKIRVWIEAMFAQASDPAASNRTRPFITNRPRLMEQHPDEMRASVHALSGLLASAVEQAAAEASADPPDEHDLLSVYHLTIARMEEHIVLGTTPTPAEIDATVRFAFRGLGLDLDS